MGKFIYGTPSLTVEFDDRVLAHVKVVITTKLRRGESFLFNWEYGTDSGSGHSSVWLHPAIPLQFEFADAGEQKMNREWLEELLRAANSNSGLRLVPEPAVEGESPPDSDTVGHKVL
ncbi:hypothetical protein [Homoserinimonas sp. OAct 916]|uniref:DUF7882 family protein n=1 Tax=Homoserinimonas sp. OAct 916 TaxID=2211450 RepID=UPI000DBE96F9|nr:hypothetical protein [Homoserinimonas sp. OAct 916]